MSNVTTTEEQINHVSKITTIFGVWKVHMILSVFQINSYLLQCWRGFSLLLRHVDFMVDWPVFTFPLSSRALRLHTDSCQRPLGPQTHSSLGKYLNTNIFTFIWLKGWAKRTSNTVDKTPTRVKMYPVPPTYRQAYLQIWSESGSDMSRVISKSL